VYDWRMDDFFCILAGWHSSFGLYKYRAFCMSSRYSAQRVVMGRERGDLYDIEGGRRDSSLFGSHAMNNNWRARSAWSGVRKRDHGIFV
jgi:hypothetical protein